MTIHFIYATHNFIHLFKVAPSAAKPAVSPCWSSRGEGLELESSAAPCRGSGEGPVRAGPSVLFTLRAAAVLERGAGASLTWWHSSRVAAPQSQQPGFNPDRVPSVQSLHALPATTWVLSNSSGFLPTPEMCRSVSQLTSTNCKWSRVCRTVPVYVGEEKKTKKKKPLDLVGPFPRCKV